MTASSTFCFYETTRVVLMQQYPIMTQRNITFYLAIFIETRSVCDSFLKHLRHRLKSIRGLTLIGTHWRGWHTLPWLGHNAVVVTHFRGWDTLPWLWHTAVVVTHCPGRDTLPCLRQTAVVRTHCRGWDTLPNTLEMRGHDVGRVFFSVINRNDFEMTEKN